MLVGDGRYYFYRVAGSDYLVPLLFVMSDTTILATFSPPSTPHRFLREHRGATLVATAFTFLVDLVRPRGREPRAGSAARERVTVRLTMSERIRWEHAAGEQPLGEWIREACNAKLRTRK